MRLADLLLRRRALSVAEFVEMHGPSAMFAAPEDPADIGQLSISWAQVVAFFAATGEVEPHEEWAKDLESLAEVLPSNAMPWVPGRWAVDPEHVYYSALFDYGKQDRRALSPQAWFGFFCVMMPFAQAERGPFMARPRMAFLRQGKSKDDPLQVVFALLASRSPRANSDSDIEMRLSFLEWSEDQQAFARRWLRRRTSAVGREPAPTA